MRISKKQYLGLTKVNYDLFSKAHLSIPINSINESIPPKEDKNNNSLPSITELYSLFNKYNGELFDGNLPNVTIEYSRQMLIAGSYTPAKKTIKLGIKYHNLFPDDIEDTLKHEMIHIVHYKHDRYFRNMADKFGVSMKAKDHSSLRRPCKYLYICLNCGKEYPRQKRLRMASCGICTPGRKFDSHFKLILVKKH